LKGRDGGEKRGLDVDKVILVVQIEEGEVGAHGGEKVDDILLEAVHLKPKADEGEGWMETGVFQDNGGIQRAGVIQLELD